MLSDADAMYRRMPACQGTRVQRRVAYDARPLYLAMTMSVMTYTTAGSFDRDVPNSGLIYHIIDMRCDDYAGRAPPVGRIRVFVICEH